MRSFVLIFIFFGIVGKAQTPFSDSLAEVYPIFDDLIENPNAKLADIQRAFELYSAKHPGEYKQYHRWAYRAQYLLKEDGTIQQGAEITKAFNDFQESVQSRSVISNWVEDGPITIPTNDMWQPNGVGRVNEIAFGPDNTIYVGAPSGGLWKSTNGGASWTPLTDALPTLGVSAILVDKDNPDIVYIGTGDRDHHDSDGKGLMKSIDGGLTFFSINQGVIFAPEEIVDIIQDPIDGDLLAIGDFQRVYRSRDAGLNWTAVELGETPLNIVFKPGDPQIVYLGTSSGKFFRSVDNGETWSNITDGIPIVTGRAFIAVSPATPNNVYFVRAEGRPFEGLYRSTDSGLSFSTMSTTPNILGYFDGGADDESTGQGWYDLAICADPVNANVIYVGGVNIWKSADGGATWTRKTFWVDNVHADQHQLVYSPAGVCYAANDGGVYLSNDGWDTYNEISTGLAISQIYRIGQSMQSQNLTLAGFQDNGTGRLSETTWTTVLGGDGMECAIDPTDDDYKYTELYFGDIRRSVGDGGYLPIGSFPDNGSWVTPYSIHPTNPNIILMSRNTGLWRTRNAKIANSSDVSWDRISTEAFGFDIAFSLVNPDLVYYSMYNKLWRSDNIQSETPTWTQLEKPLGSVNLINLLSDPNNESILYGAAANSRIFKSVDKGENWSEITSNFPNLSIFDLVYDKTTEEGIYASTAAGVYYKEPGTDNWTSFSKNLPVSVEGREMEIYYDDVNPSNSRIRLGTFGRGVWHSSLASTTLPVDLVSFVGKKISHQVVQLDWKTSSEVNNDFFIVQRSIDGHDFEDIGIVQGAGYSSETLSYQLMDRDPFDGINYYRLVQKDFDGVKTFHNVIAVSFAHDGYKGVEIYPNPIKGDFVLYIDNQYIGLFDVEIYNQIGQKIFEMEQVSNGRYTIDLAGYPNGIYYLEVRNQDVLNTQKIFKQGD